MGPNPKGPRSGSCERSSYEILRVFSGSVGPVIPTVGDFLDFQVERLKIFDIRYLRFAVKLQVVGKTYSKIPPNAGFFHDDLQFYSTW